MMSWGSLVHLADLIGASEGAAETVTPMRFANVISLTREGQREVARMRWGFVPKWACCVMGAGVRHWERVNEF